MAQIGIAGLGFDDKAGTPGSSTTLFPALRRMASSDQTRPNTPLGLSTLNTSSTRFYTASSMEGTTRMSGPFTRNASSANLGAVPIPASKVQRNVRKRTVPKPTLEVKIARGGKTVFDYPQTVDDWVPTVHPDGALYFDPKRRIYTDANLFDEEERSIISYYAGQLLQQADEMDGFPSTTCVLVLERTDEGCGYYFGEPGKRSIFWLEDVSIKKLTMLPRVDSLAHIKYLMEAETHRMLFPDRWSVTPEVVTELKKMVLHAISDNVLSTTSVIPFDQEELTQILDLIDALKDGIKELFPHANCIVARFMGDFALSNFFNFCGQPWARLNSDQSIFRKSKYKRTFLIQILSLALLWTPLYYAGELDKVWNDHVINRLMWRAFIAKFSNDWSSLSLSATVILGTNVAFLALTDVNVVAKSFNFVSTVASVGVVLIGLILVHHYQGHDFAERVVEGLYSVVGSGFGTEPLAILFSIPYALLKWSMVWFVTAFACMVFTSAHPVAKTMFAIAGVLVGLCVVWTARITRFREEYD